MFPYHLINWISICWLDSLICIILSLAICMHLFLRHDDMKILSCSSLTFLSSFLPSFLPSFLRTFLPSYFPFLLPSIYLIYLIRRIKVIVRKSIFWLVESLFQVLNSSSYFHYLLYCLAKLFWMLFFFF